MISERVAESTRERNSSIEGEREREREREKEREDSSSSQVGPGLSEGGGEDPRR